MQERIGPVRVVERAALFEDELTASVKTMKLQICYLAQSSLINLTLTLKISNLQRELLNNSHLFYMNPHTRVCQHLGIYPFHQDIFLEIDIKNKERLHFKYRKISNPYPYQPQTKIQTKQTNHLNSRKSRQRTIGEVKHHLETRNKIYQNANVSGQTYTLQKAADLIGLPKKSLDDYTKHIRVAQSFGFDFEKHKDAGMGFLRNFVKQQTLKQRTQQPKIEFVQPDVFWSINTKPNP